MNYNSLDSEEIRNAQDNTKRVAQGVKRKLEDEIKRKETELYFAKLKVSALESKLQSLQAEWMRTHENPYIDHDSQRDKAGHVLRLLREIRESPNLTMEEYAQRLGTKGSSVYEWADTLLRHGFVIRESNPNSTRGSVYKWLAAF